MKKTMLFSLLFFACAVAANAQETIKKKGYTLTFSSQDKNFSPELKARMIKTFFEVYPKLAKTYNKNTSKDVKFVIDTAYDGVAATSDDRVVYSAAYMDKRPQDIDVVTHEVMHIVQAYGNTNGPGWLTEGIADYVRFKFGVDNAGAGWSLPPYKEGQSYENSYRITARFLDWIERNKKAGIVKTLDDAMRKHAYTPEIWNTQTGKDLDGLWAEYIANPNA
ncbi:MAG: secretory protein [Mucilaginibacter polytrichastri]|nr:secretory protein [Mucilaginibacter polytrichastri]